MLMEALQALLVASAVVGAALLVILLVARPRRRQSAYRTLDFVAAEWEPAGRGRAANLRAPYPPEMQIFVFDSVIGVWFRRDACNKFLKGAALALAWEREYENPHDYNAIKIYGLVQGMLGASSYFIGYCPRELAAWIARSEMFDELIPRLVRIYHRSNEYYDIQFEVLGPKSSKKEFDAVNWPREWPAHGTID